MPTNKLSYKKIRKLRQILTDELGATSPALTVEHLKLVELRVQTALLAGLDDDEVSKEEEEFKSQ